jgi:hypothetical protein
MPKLQKSSDEIYREPGKPAWLKDCILNVSGKPLPNLANVLTVLRAVLADSFAYDEPIGGQRSAD